MTSPSIPTVASPAEPSLRTLALVAMLLSAAMYAQVSGTSPQVEPSATLGRCTRHAHHRLVRKPPAEPRLGQSSWCIHLAGNTPRQPPPPAPGEEIDPAFGEMKRLVPSGPNPLHN